MLITPHLLKKKCLNLCIKYYLGKYINLILSFTNKYRPELK